MTWRDRLQKGTFRDAAFLIESDDTQLGRRTVLFEYPLRDVPFTEDLGRKSREFRIDCLVIGADYMAARDALMAAIDAPGPGTLVHPYLGRMQVAVMQASKRESTAEGGLARFSITFAEAGENIQPAASAAAGSATRQRSAAARTALQDSFDRSFSVIKKSQFVEQSALSVAGGALDALRRLPAAFGDATGLAALSADAAALGGTLDTAVRTPSLLSGSLYGLIAGYANAFLSPFNALTGLRALFNHGSTLAAVPTTTPARVAQAQNQQAVVSLVQGAAVVEAARLTADMDFTDRGQAIALRDEIADRLDAQAIVGDDTAFVALTDLRVAVVEDINARGARLPNMIDVTLPETLPALVVSHRIYGDATRDAEIVARNRVPHPGFVAGGRMLEVLSVA